MFDLTATGLVLWALLHSAQLVTEHVFQTRRQRVGKSKPRGRGLCLSHVTTGTFLSVVAVHLLVRVADWHPDPVRVAGAVCLTGAVHYVADRRIQIARLVRLAGGRVTWIDNGPLRWLVGPAWHIAWVPVATALMVL